MEAHRQLMLGANVHRPGTKYKRLKISFAVTSIAFIVVQIRYELLQFPAGVWQRGYRDSLLETAQEAVTIAPKCAYT